MACYHTTMPAGQKGSSKRVSLVRLRKDVSRAECLELWSSAHAEVVREIPGVAAYTVDIASESRPAGSWDALATIRFGDPGALRTLEHDPEVRRRLLATREEFIEAVDAFLVDEHTLIP